jgi:predicted acyl esterase
MGDDLHHNGAFFLSQNFDFFYWFEAPSDDPLHDSGRNFVTHSHDGYDFYLRLGALGNSDKLFKGAFPAWTEFLAHPNYDAFWKARNVGPNLKDIHCAVMTVGGWYDAEDLYGALATYRATERQNPGITNLLVMGPWSHGQWSHGDGDKLGDMNFHLKTSPALPGEDRAALLPPFPQGRHELHRDRGADVRDRHGQVAAASTRGRRRTRRPGRCISTPAANSHFTAPTEGADAFDEYVSDPAKPVPFTMEVTMDYPRGFPTHDQRFAAARPDVLVYVTEPLEEDLTLAGPLTGGAERLHDRHRCRLRAEAYRRVRQRLSQPGAESGAPRHGRLPAARARRRDARRASARASRSPCR